jgi:hypothetical protein
VTPNDGLTNRLDTSIQKGCSSSYIMGAISELSVVIVLIVRRSVITCNLISTISVPRILIVVIVSRDLVLCDCAFAQA